MNGEPTKDEEAQAYAQLGHSELVERLRRRNGDGVHRVVQPDELADQAAAALTAKDEEIARLTRERDEARSATERFLERAVAAECERCAKIAEQSNCSSDKGYAYGAGYADTRAAIAAAIRGGKP